MLLGQYIYSNVQREEILIDQSNQVGWNLKNPLSPIWILASETVNSLRYTLISIWQLIKPQIN